jgi:NADH:ubiquinone oxidoreductase subunit 6 (subunit J)
VYIFLLYILSKINILVYVGKIMYSYLFFAACRNKNQENETETGCAYIELELQFVVRTEQSKYDQW